MTKKRYNSNSAAREASSSERQADARSLVQEPKGSSPSPARTDPQSPPSGGSSKQHPPSGSQSTEIESESTQPHAVQRASAFSVAQEQLNRVASVMDLDDDLREHLSMPRRELIVHFPVVMDDGSMRNFTGFRVHHNTALGPTKAVSYTHLTLPTKRIV